MTPIFQRLSHISPKKPQMHGITLCKENQKESLNACVRVIHALIYFMKMMRLL